MLLTGISFCCPTPHLRGHFLSYHFEEEKLTFKSERGSTLKRSFSLPSFILSANFYSNRILLARTVKDRTKCYENYSRRVANLLNYLLLKINNVQGIPGNEHQQFDYRYSNSVHTCQRRFAYFGFWRSVHTHTYISKCIIT